jgi:hypothetical protein
MKCSAPQARAPVKPRIKHCISIQKRANRAICKMRGCYFIKLAVKSALSGRDVSLTVPQNQISFNIAIPFGLQHLLYNRSQKDLGLSGNPVRHIFPGTLHFLIVGVAQGIMLMNQRPECPRMIHVHCMAKLMHHDVADKMLGQKKQLAVQGYRTTR